MFGCLNHVHTKLTGWCCQLCILICKASINISWITGVDIPCILCWYADFNGKRDESQAWSASSHGLAELCWRGLGRVKAHARAHHYWCFDFQTLEFVTVSAAKAYKAAWAVERVCPTLCSHADLLWCHSPGPLCLKNTLGSLICRHNVPPLFCFIIVVTLAFWFNPKTAHCLCLQLAYLFCYETNPRHSLSIFNVSLAQRFLASACNYGQWGVAIHERIQLSETSWQPGGGGWGGGGLWVWLPHWLVHFVSLCKISHVPFDLFLMSLFFRVLV